MSEHRGRHEIKHYINYADILQLRARLPFVANVDQHATDDNGYRLTYSPWLKPGDSGIKQN